MAGVQFRLTAGSYRELHWHQQSEWAYVLEGSTTIAVVNTEGKNYVKTVNKGDLWYAIRALCLRAIIQSSLP